MKLLLIEDENYLRNSILEFLSNENYLVEFAHDYFTAEKKLAGYDYDLIILDINLPGGSGLDLLTIIKEFYPHTGVLIISALSSLPDKITGLNHGADDYLTKPFHLVELKARIAAIIRRRQLKGKMSICYEEISIDPDQRCVFVNGHQLELTKKEFDLLVFLVVNQNRVLTKEAIAEHLWGDHIDMADNFDFIYTHIKNLRRKIETKGGANYLKTIYGIGYKFGL